MRVRRAGKSKQKYRVSAFSKLLFRKKWENIHFEWGEYRQLTFMVMRSKEILLQIYAEIKYRFHVFYIHNKLHKEHKLKFRILLNLSEINSLNKHFYSIHTPAK